MFTKLGPDSEQEVPPKKEQKPQTDIREKPKTRENRSPTNNFFT